MRSCEIRMRKAIPVLAMALISAAAGAGEPGGLLVKDGESVAFMGDSITEAGAKSPQGYVQLVIRGLAANGVNVTPFYAGVSGHKSNQMLERLDRDVLSKKPNWMTLSCGVNDVWHGANGVPLDDYRRNITTIVARCQAAGVKVMILTATMIGEDQPNENNQKLAAYNEFLRSLAREKNCPLADLNADMQAAVAKAGPDKRGNLLTTDGVHMNRDGNVLMAVGVLKAFGMSDAQIEAAKGWSGPEKERKAALAAAGPAPRLMFFFGDSITKAGGYFRIIRDAIVSQNPGNPPVIHNFGHMSETVSNLSEAYHPGRRPCILNWVGNVVSEKPNMVVACYGINDGIYHPFNEQRFAAYTNGVETLIRKFHAVGTYVVLLTPPPFAAAGPALPADADEATRQALLDKANAEAEVEAQKNPNKFGFRSAYPYYDKVMARYAAWVMTLADRDGVSVVDIRTPLLARIGEAYGGDAIHPNGTGHAIMAEAFLKQWPAILAKANAYAKAANPK